MHFHKAGGSSVVELARRNGETFWPKHRNGNPYDSNGKVHRPWELSADGLHAFIDGALESGVSFVATEWGVPDTSVLAARDEVVSITVLREPLARIVSSWRYSYLGGHTSASSALEWVDHHVNPHTLTNYYTRMLLGPEWMADTERDELVNRAWERLGHFDVVVTLEDATWSNQVAAAAGWTHQHVHANRTNRTLRGRLRGTALAIKAGRLDVAAHRLRQSPPRVSESDVHLLSAMNELDTRLYSRLLEQNSP